MKKNIRMMLFCIAGLVGCNQATEPEFKPPMGPYGLPYRVGNLGGKPVLLGEEVAWLEYEDSPVLKPENRHWWYKAPPRNFDSIVTAFGVHMKYTTELVFIGYHAAPRESSQQYYAERELLNNEWVSIGINSGIRYHPDLTAAFINSTVNSKVQSLQGIKDTHYIYIYIPAHKQEFGLEKYVPHSEWLNRVGYEETRDMYLERDKNGQVITLIRCNNLPIDNLARKCEMRWNLEPFMKVQLEARFARAHLKDWQIIQACSEKLIKSFVVNPKNLKTN